MPGFTSGNTFKQQDGSDPTLNGSGGSGIAGCDALPPRLVPAAGGIDPGRRQDLPAPHEHRRPGQRDDQLPTNARNGWAIFAKATGTAPKIYGIGAMEMYSPLPSGASSTFYLAQIEAAHAGKTMEIKLFDAGDTNQRCQHPDPDPDGCGLERHQLRLHREPGHDEQRRVQLQQLERAPACPTSRPTRAAASRFNGCWITIHIPIPTTYTAHAVRAGGRSATT